MNRAAFVVFALAAAGCGHGPAGRTIADCCRDLKSPDAGTRMVAADALAALGPAAKSAVPDLAATLHDADPRVRAKACVALWSIGPLAAAAVPDLAAALNDKSVEVRLTAAGALS